MTQSYLSSESWIEGLPKGKKAAGLPFSGGLFLCPFMNYAILQKFGAALQYFDGAVDPLLMDHHSIAWLFWAGQKLGSAVCL